ncbi:unnamed protein product [Linum trigynum]|uniref:Secreted protein n=1 Tax=Linum trigynum TaxID=586398 RepID=A0AAV2G3G4_9ROSI
MAVAISTLLTAVSSSSTSTPSAENVVSSLYRITLSSHKKCLFLSVTDSDQTIEGKQRTHIGKGRATDDGIEGRRRESQDWGRRRTAGRTKAGAERR